MKKNNSVLFNYLRSRPLQTVGLVISIISIILMIIGPYIVPHSATLGDSGNQLQAPNAEYWFGTDSNGMCVFSRCLAAYRTDLCIVIVGALLALGIGLPLGVIGGYFDGRKGFWGGVSTVIMRVADIFQAFPSMVLGLLLVAIFGPNWLNLMLLICITNLPQMLRMARTGIITIRDSTFVDAARSAGNSEFRIAFHHIMPNILSPVIALFSVTMGFGILLIAGLSFVGAGVRAPTPEWGSMIAIGSSVMISGKWWPSVFPGVFMAITVFGFSMVGDIITTLTDPLERLKYKHAEECVNQKKAKKNKKVAEASVEATAVEASAVEENTVNTAAEN